MSLPCAYHDVLDYCSHEIIQLVDTGQPVLSSDHKLQVERGGRAA